jgi:hypothetical protein
MINKNHKGVEASYRDIARNLVCSNTSGTDSVIVITNVKNIMDSVIQKDPNNQFKAINRCLDMVEGAKERLKDLLPCAPGII